jgi:CRP-like cAMP-binding protein
MLTQTAVRNASWKKTASGPVPPAAPQPQTGLLDMMGAQMSFPRNAEIYGEGEAADYIYRVVSGAVRTYKVLADGRRQVGGFYLPGDMFGLEPGDEHTFSAEAIAESKMLVIKRSAVMALAERDGEVARQLWNLTGRELSRVQDHILLLIKSAHERVATFLLEMAERETHPPDAVGQERGQGVGSCLVAPEQGGKDRRVVLHVAPGSNPAQD